jgi:hypothetical protein
VWSGHSCPLPLPLIPAQAMGAPFPAHFVRRPALSEAEGWDSTTLNPPGFLFQPTIIAQPDVRERAILQRHVIPQAH